MKQNYLNQNQLILSKPTSTGQNLEKSTKFLFKIPICYLKQKPLLLVQWKKTICNHNMFIS